MRVRWKVKVEFCVKCGVWGDKSSGGENWGQGMCKTVMNSIVNSNFADVCAFEDVIAKNINHCATCTIGWLVVRCRGRHGFRLIPVSKCQLRRRFVSRDPKVLRRVSRILIKEGLHFANRCYIFE